MIHDYEKLPAWFGEPVVLARRTPRGFDPIIGYDPLVLQPPKKRIQRALDHDQLILGEYSQDIGRIGFSSVDDRKYGVLEYTLTHLYGDF